MDRLCLRAGRHGDHAASKLAIAQTPYIYSLYFVPAAYIFCSWEYLHVLLEHSILATALSIDAEPHITSMTTADVLLCIWCHCNSILCTCVRTSAIVS